MVRFNTHYNESTDSTAGMSEYDRYCPFYKTSAMLRNFVGFHDAAVKAVQQSDLTFAKIKDSASDIMFKLSQMKFEVRRVLVECIIHIYNLKIFTVAFTRER